MTNDRREFEERMAAVCACLEAVRAESWGHEAASCPPKLEPAAPPADAAGFAARWDELLLAIEQLRATGETLAESEERFRAAAELAGARVYERDFQSGVAEYFGDIDTPMGFLPGEYPRTVVGWIEMMHPDDSGKVLEAAKQSLTTGAPYVVPMRLRRKDGSYSVWLDRAKLVRDRDGHPVKWRGVAIDISAQVDAETAARESAQRLADIIDFLPDPTMVIDVDGVCVAWNRALEALTGVPAAAVLGKGNYEYSLAFWDKRAPILIDLALQPDEEVERRYAICRRDGDTISAELFVPKLRHGAGAFLESTAAVLRDPQGRIAGAIGCARDVTERTLAKQRALAADRAKSEFLASMSHELRTPLNAILGFAQVITARMAGDLNGQQAQYVESILISGRHLLNLINDVLDLSKIEAGKMALTLAPVRIDELLASALIMVRDRARAHDIALALNVRPELGERTIRADEHKLRQVLYNLLSNAVKFTPDGGAVEVGAVRQNGEVVISVADNGIGVSPENQARIFEAFEQVDSGFARQSQGTGLGLALSRRFVELHGGRIRVESPGEGLGSTFYFSIPDAANEQ